MPIDFSQVKKITIPEGDVKSISVGGVVIWEVASAKVLTSITLSGQTTSLNRGAAFSFGGTVTAHYSDSSTADVTSSTTFSGYNMSTAGTYTVTATYTEDGVTKTATYSLTVNKAWSTVWSGSNTISWTLGSNWQSNKPGNRTVWDNPNIPDPSDIRITFTMSNRVGAGNYANASTTNWTLTTKPSSPYVVNNLNTSSNATKTLLGVEGTKSGDHSTGQARLMFQWYKVSNTKRFRLVASTGEYSQAPASGTISLTITKIERYY